MLPQILTQFASLWASPGQSVFHMFSVFVMMPKVSLTCKRRHTSFAVVRKPGFFSPCTALASTTSAPIAIHRDFIRTNSK